MQYNHGTFVVFYRVILISQSGLIPNELAAVQLKASGLYIPLVVMFKIGKDVSALNYDHSNESV